MPKVEFSTHMTVQIECSDEFKEFIIKRWRDFQAGRIKQEDLPDSLPLSDLPKDSDEYEVLTYCLALPFLKVQEWNLHKVFTGEGAIPGIAKVHTGVYVVEPGTCDKVIGWHKIQRVQ